MTSTTEANASSSLAYDDDQEVVCYLCLDGGVDEAGQPLRRDCVLVEGLTPDLSISHALSIMHQPKVYGLVI